MSTYREIVYMIQDELKLVSDDSFYTTDHIRYLANKFRSFLLKKTYSDVKKVIPESNYQLLCIDLEEVDTNPGDPCAEGVVLRSTRTLPDTLELGTPRVLPSGLFGGDIQYVSIRRFENVGYNRFTQNFIFATLGPDNYLYLKSTNPQYKYLEKAKFYGIFDDPEKASDASCEEGDTCDIMDRTFPLENPLIPALIQLVVKELAGPAYQPKDDVNNAGDDLSNLASFIRRNMKSTLQRALNEDAVQ